MELLFTNFQNNIQNSFIKRFASPENYSLSSLEAFFQLYNDQFVFFSSFTALNPMENNEFSLLFPLFLSTSDEIIDKTFERLRILPINKETYQFLFKKIKLIIPKPRFFKRLSFESSLMEEKTSNLIESQHFLNFYEVYMTYFSLKQSKNPTKLDFLLKIFDLIIIKTVFYQNIDIIAENYPKMAFLDQISRILLVFHWILTPNTLINTYPFFQSIEFLDNLLKKPRKSLKNNEIVLFLLNSLLNFYISNEKPLVPFIISSNLIPEVIFFLEESLSKQRKLVFGNKFLLNLIKSIETIVNPEFERGFYEEIYLMLDEYVLHLIEPTFNKLFSIVKAPFLWFEKDFVKILMKKGLLHRNLIVSKFTMGFLLKNKETYKYLDFRTDFLLNIDDSKLNRKLLFSLIGKKDPSIGLLMEKALINEFLNEKNGFLTFLLDFLAFIANSIKSAYSILFLLINLQRIIKDNYDFEADIGVFKGFLEKLLGFLKVFEEKNEGSGLQITILKVLKNIIYEIILKNTQKISLQYKFEVFCLFLNIICEKKVKKTLKLERKLKKVSFLVDLPNISFVSLFEKVFIAEEKGFFQRSPLIPFNIRLKIVKTMLKLNWPIEIGLFSCFFKEINLDCDIIKSLKGLVGILKLEEAFIEVIKGFLSKIKGDLGLLEGKEVKMIKRMVKMIGKKEFQVVFNENLEKNERNLLFFGKIIRIFNENPLNYPFFIDNYYKEGNSYEILLISLILLRKTKRKDEFICLFDKNKGIILDYIENNEINDQKTMKTFCFIAPYLQNPLILNQILNKISCFLKGFKAKELENSPFIDNFLDLIEICEEYIQNPEFLMKTQEIIRFLMFFHSRLCEIISIRCLKSVILLNIIKKLILDSFLQYDWNSLISIINSPNPPKLDEKLYILNEKLWPLRYFLLEFIQTSEKHQKTFDFILKTQFQVLFYKGGEDNPLFDKIRTNILLNLCIMTNNPLFPSYILKEFDNFLLNIKELLLEPRFSTKFRHKLQLFYLSSYNSIVFDEKSIKMIDFCLIKPLENYNLPYQTNASLIIIASYIIILLLQRNGSLKNDKDFLNENNFNRNFLLIESLLKGILIYNSHHFHAVKITVQVLVVSLYENPIYRLFLDNNIKEKGLLRQIELIKAFVMNNKELNTIYSSNNIGKKPFNVREETDIGCLIGDLEESSSFCPVFVKYQRNKGFCMSLYENIRKTIAIVFDFNPKESITKENNRISFQNRNKVGVNQLIHDIKAENSDNNKEIKGDFIVIASLLDNLPNIAGLCRSCEIFGIKTIAIKSKTALKEAAFKKVSVTSENLLNVLELPVSRILSFLKNKKEEDYKVIALEQASNSICLSKFIFPIKTVFIVGQEQLGVPNEILNFCDYVIEIPQFGHIKSLNAHVASSLLIWEFVKQREKIF